MNFDETLRLIAAAQGKPDQLALVTVEIVLSGQPPADRDALRAALDAAAVPSWFDAALLASLLDPELVPRAAELFTRLCVFPFVERFPARGETAHNVHEATRLPWRARLRAEQPKRSRELSLRTVAALQAPEDKTAPASHRIEAIYHRLVVLPTEESAAECEALAREWQRAGRMDERQALAAALGELEQAGLLCGIVCSVSLMGMAEARWSFQPLDATGKELQDAYELCESAGDTRRLARALVLQGQIAKERGDLTAAMRAFERSLTLRHGSAKQRPGDAELENELADIHSYIGDVRLAQGDWAGARAAFGADQAISQKLAAQDLGNANWQRGLAVTWRKLGDLAKRTEDLTTARREWANALTIFERLTKLDPTNADWRDNAAALRQRLSELPT